LNLLQTDVPSDPALRGSNYAQPRGFPFTCGIGFGAWTTALAVLVLGLGGCRGCFGQGAAEVAGDTPYVRCLGGSPPSAGTRRVGRLSLRIEGRSLSITGLGPRVTFAAFSGPGLGQAPAAAEVAALRAAGPDLLLLLGDLGDTPKIARATLGALASLPIPTLLVAGGRDTPERVAAAIDGLGSVKDRITDATGLREIRIGSDTLIPVAGAAEGRYALEPRACGYGLSDLKRVASELVGAPRSRRWLLAWQAPGGGGAQSVARTDLGVDVGSQSLAELGTRIGARGGIFGWPHVQLLRPSAALGARRVGVGEAAADLQIVVPRLAGPAMERADGSHVLPGFAVLRLDSDGLQLLETRSIN
jgi:hypothetical protein